MNFVVSVWKAKLFEDLNLISIDCQKREMFLPQGDEKICWDLAVDAGIHGLLGLVLTELLLHGADISVLRYPCKSDYAAISIYRCGIKTDKSQGPDFQLHLFMEIKGFLETQLQHA